MSKSKKQQVAKHLTNALHIEQAPGYFTSSEGGTKNWEPALLVLVIGVIGLNTVRAGHLPDGAQAVTWIVLCGLVVLAGAFVPGFVAVALIGLLIAGALNLNNQLTGLVDRFTAKVGDLSTTAVTAQPAAGTGNIGLK